ncbi:MAG: diaminopimelate decarboxylase, partial [Firmicutes bacterium]|nr:diaminopimelate decarboxylase [Bacillota bacterium]
MGLSMELRGTMGINERGHLEIGGCDTVDLAARFGTPLYVFDEELIREQCRAYQRAFARHYPNGRTIYAGKAFLTLAMCRL